MSPDEGVLAWSESFYEVEASFPARYTGTGRTFLVDPASHSAGTGTFALPRWASDGRSILYVERAGEVDNVWSLALDGGKPRQVTRFTSGHIRSLAVSPDGRRLALSRGTESVDAVLIRDFR